MKVLIVEQDGKDDECISILAKSKEFELIKVGRLDGCLDLREKERAGKDRIVVDKVNATDPEEIAQAAKGMDLVVDLVDSWMSPYVKKGALKAESNYVNPKADISFWSKFKEGKRKLQNAPNIVSPEIKSYKHKKGI